MMQITGNPLIIVQSVYRDDENLEEADLARR
jgi:hypothetical protein